MNTILCPVDFSNNSKNAIRYVLAMNKVLKAKIILLHTFDTPFIYGDIAPFTAQLDYKYIHDAAANKLRSFRKKYFGDDAEVEMILQPGLPSARTIEIAMEKKVSVIVMGATGTGAAARLFIGSNALRVAKQAHCAVMLIPEKARFTKLDKIVCATDLSEENLTHTRELFPMAKKFNSELMYLYVHSIADEKDEEVLKVVSKKIKEFVPYPKKSGYICTDVSVASGVEYFLRKHLASCLVIYHRHRNVIQAIYDPSLSSQILLHTKLPIIVLHADDYMAGF